MVPFFNVIDYGNWLTTYKNEYYNQFEVFFSIYLKILRLLHIPYDSISKISIKDNLLELKDQLTQYVQKYAIKLDFFDFSLSDTTSLDIHSQMPTFYYLYSYINNPEFDSSESRPNFLTISFTYSYVSTKSIIIGLTKPTCPHWQRMLSLFFVPLFSSMAAGREKLKMRTDSC